MNFQEASRTFRRKKRTDRRVCWWFEVGVFLRLFLMISLFFPFRATSKHTSFAGFVFEFRGMHWKILSWMENINNGYQARKQFNSIQSIKLSNPLPLLGSQQTHNIKINLKSTQSIKLSKPLPLLILLAHSTE